MTIIEQESCYQVIQLIKEHPSLSNLFLKLQSRGRNWVDILKMLREALEERSMLLSAIIWPRRTHHQLLRCLDRYSLGPGQRQLMMSHWSLPRSVKGSEDEVPALPHFQPHVQVLAQSIMA
jgi:hypothetical protein